MEDFTISALDHVAIKVMDMQVSAKWYELVLGLRRCDTPEWGAFPVMLLAGKTGVALFPAKGRRNEFEWKQKLVRIDHFAFNVTNDDFAKAQERFRQMGIGFEFQDHQYFHSIYLKDPDGHTVELTTLVVDEADFYK